MFDVPRWQGFPVTRCPYTDISATAHPLLLNADTEKLAHWVVTACLDAKAIAADACIKWLAGEMKEASSYNVFPVAGYIPEPEFGGYCFLFRDGVTVKTALRPEFAKPTNGSCGDDDAESKLSLTWAGRFARIASTTREDYALLYPDVRTDGVLWVDVARQAYQKAWGSSRNDLLSAKAIGGAKARAFR